MTMRTLIMTGVAALVWHTPAFAEGSIDERLANTERRVNIWKNGSPLKTG